MLNNRSAQKIPALTAVSSVFGRYKPEERHEIRQADVEGGETRRQLGEAWKNYKWDGNLDARWVEVCDLVRNLICSAKDVENFSIALAEFQDEKDFSEKAGLFLSALINNGKDNDYIIHTKHLEKKINFIGH